MITTTLKIIRCITQGFFDLIREIKPGKTSIFDSFEIEYCHA